jgi:hypothetical protein
VPVHALIFGADSLLWAALLGLAAGVLSAAMSQSIYFFEDLFKKTPVHWMWWPAIGGLVIGLGGVIEPRALGVGYDQIGALLDGDGAVKAILVLVVVKWAIWSFSLGSGTSGGVLAPLLMIGCALGTLAGHVLPDQGAGFWALVAMGAVLAGTMRAPLMGIMFAVEVTHDWGSMVPITIAVMMSYGFTVLVLKRSILTEKVARRGYHLTYEYAIDPLEILFVRDVVELEPTVIPRPPNSARLPAEMRAHLDDTLRTIAYRMASQAVTALPILDDAGDFLGEITLSEVLKARLRHLEQETRRERVIPVHRLIPGWLRRAG